ncbi:MAG: hypothetical protein IT429_09940 [Gemmataceae bacterium]|nr:hypothetical protein [Gemmataceae bacterium]
MNRLAVAWATGVGIAALGVFLSAGPSRADIDPGIKGGLDKIAKALQKGDSATASKEGQALAKKTEELLDIMYAFKLRTKKGLGVGEKAGVVVPDGIELKLNAIERDGITPGALTKEAKNLEEAAWMTAAVAEATLAKAPAKDMGKKTKAKWSEFSVAMRDGSKELAAAAKGMKAADVKAAATKVNNACNGCHTIFRD